MLKNILKIIGGDPVKQEIKRASAVVTKINSMEGEYEALSDDALRAKTDEFRRRLNDGETLDDLLPEAFTAVREASKRTIGLRHYDVQMIGAQALHQKKIVEMRTGEGKTLVATLPLYLNALTGRGVHLVTVNDYLARRDARWMAPIYYKLGMTVGVLQMAGRTENGVKAFLVDLEHTSPHEDQHQLSLVARRDAYQADITYGTNSEFGFDYLRDNLTMRLEDRVQRGHYYAIVDEVDNILIDEARTPLIISGPSSEDTELYLKMSQIVRQLQPEDYEINEKDRSVSLTESGEVRVEELLEQPLRDPERPEDITPEQARLLGYLEQSLRAQHLYRRNKDYLVQGGKVVIVDEFTGRLMPGRRWSEGLHQAVEAKEGVKIEPENITYATITLQNYFRMYEKLAGMTGTALTEAEEFYKIYKLDVLPLPTNLEYSALQTNSPMVEVEGRDEQNYRYRYYTRRDDTERKPIYWRRKDYPDVVYPSEEAKLRAISQDIVRCYVVGQPLLVGTTSVEHSERLSNRLQAEPIRRLMQVMLIRHRWRIANKIDAVEIAIPELKPLSKTITELDITLLRQKARELNMSLNIEEPANLETMLEILRLQAEDRVRLVKVTQGGIPHQVLNARRHDEESQIIARAGAFGSVTIATNMAGRGVDIKLGGDLHEEVLADVQRVLLKAGIEDPYDMTNPARLEALKKVSPENYDIYEEAVKAFFQYMDEMARVRQLGGLYVIGSERHEARRIDNQLRGRAARQGDPGASRFYLSLEDDLMRLFGGAQAEALFKRFNVDDNLPIEYGILGRLVEQSQTRVEGANFDIRKHLLEYDDVLNAQRKRIYGQRDRVFTKENLSEDVLEMLKTELQHRIPTALKDEEGPWKLLGYLEDIQPPIDYSPIFYPSLTLSFLASEIKAGTLPKLRETLLDLAQRALAAEREHILRSARTLVENSGETLDKQISEMSETLDNFIEGLGQNDASKDNEEEAEPMPPVRPQDVFNEMIETLHVPFKLTPEQIRHLPEADDQVVTLLRQQLQTYLTDIALSRLGMAFERRLEEVLSVRANQVLGTPWEEAADRLYQCVEESLERRVERLLGKEGQIVSDLDTMLNRLGEDAFEEDQLPIILNTMAHGMRRIFDRKTHRQGVRLYKRLEYIYLAAKMLEGRSADVVTAMVLDHLNEAQENLELAWGNIEFDRLAQNEVALQQLDDRMREQLTEAFGAERFAILANQPLASVNGDDRQLVCEIFGARLQNDLYRQLLLSVISEQWIEYLTKVEGLRVSIGLEAYAQRDPLVQYKSKATEMFQNLLTDIRMGTIGRMFTTQPRRSAANTMERSSETENATGAEQSRVNVIDAGEDAQAKKRRRRR